MCLCYRYVNPMQPYESGLKVPQVLSTCYVQHFPETFHPSSMLATFRLPCCCGLGFALQQNMLHVSASLPAMPLHPGLD